MLLTVPFRLLLPLAALALLLGAAAALWTTGSSRSGATTAPRTTDIAALPPPRYERLRWHRSRALGAPTAGRLVRGVRLPSEGRDFFTWDPVRRRTPNRAWRRWGTDRLVRTVLRVLRAHRAANPGAGRVGVGDLSRPRGGDFGPRFGSVGHASHQNGLDADIYYPRADGRELRARRADQIDRGLAQDLVDRFARAGAEYVFVGPATGLRGPRGVVETLRRHDDHLHVRLRARPGGR
jgi:murein endopeptidase